MQKTIRFSISCQATSKTRIYTHFPEHFSKRRDVPLRYQIYGTATNALRTPQRRVYTIEECEWFLGAAWLNHLKSRKAAGSKEIEWKSRCTKLSRLQKGRWEVLQGRGRRWKVEEAVDKKWISLHSIVMRTAWAESRTWISFSKNKCISGSWVRKTFGHLFRCLKERIEIGFERR